MIRSLATRTRQNVTFATCALTLALGGVAAADVPADKTLWLIQPLYPEQDPLLTRTEEAIQKLIPKENRAAEVVGRKELADALKGRTLDLRCLFGEVSCTDPLDAVVSGLGFGRVVLVKVGQDDSGYRFKIAHYFPGTAEVVTTESVNRNLDLALTGALVKVVPLASRVDFVSNPPGARIFIDGDKVGTTPLATQVLPGEHVIKFELGGYKTTESTWTVPVRGALKVEQALEKLPARIILTAYPPGTNIFVDQKLLGKDKVDQGIEPGKHVIRFAVDGYVPYQTTTDIKADDTYVLTKTLEPTTWQGIKIAMHYAQEDIYSRKSSFVVAFETMTLVSADVDAKSRVSDSNVRTTRLLSPAPSSARFNGISAEYAASGRYFGLMVLGVAFSQASSKPWLFQLNSDADPGFTTINTSVEMLTIRALHPQLRLALWRFSFGIQAGFELRGMRISEQVTPEHYKDGFLFIDTQLAAQGSVRLFVFEGLFLEGAYRRTWTVTGISNGSGPGLRGFRGGIGYAF